MTEEQPARREEPNLASLPFVEEGDGYLRMYGSNAPVFRDIEPLPPVSQAFYFSVRAVGGCRPVLDQPSRTGRKVGEHREADVVRVVDFEGDFARLAPETEAQAKENWQGWMLVEEDDQTYLEEIEDPNMREKEQTRSLFQRLWRVSDHIVSRLRDRDSERTRRYMDAGRVPPGQKDHLPDATRCLNAFWGLEARWVPLPKGQEYWPQGCLQLENSVLKAGWQQTSEEFRQGHWRVFAARPFKEKELIEVCPLVKVDAETCFASLPLRMNLIETAVQDDSNSALAKFGRVENNLPLGYGMLYQQSIELEDVQMNWKPVTNFNCKFIPFGRHMYIYATRNIDVDEELILEYKRAFRTDQGEPIDFTGFTPYFQRREPPEIFAKALTAPCGPRRPRPLPGRVKFGKSELHERGVFADASYKRGEIVEICPCLSLDLNGAHCMEDYCFHLPPMTKTTSSSSSSNPTSPSARAATTTAATTMMTSREGRYVLPCGYGGLYNHLPTGAGENVEWYFDETTNCMVFIASPPTDEGKTAEIPRNTELCFDYGDAFWDAPARRQQRPGKTT